jgi:hypothetical protein
MSKPRTKVVQLGRGWLGFGDRRRHQKAIDKWERKGYRYMETVKKWRGYELIFTRDDG